MPNAKTNKIYQSRLQKKSAEMFWVERLQVAADKMHANEIDPTTASDESAAKPNQVCPAEFLVR